MSPRVNTGPCNCLCYQNFEIPHQPTATDLKKSKSQAGSLGPFKPVGMLNSYGSVYAFRPTRYFAMFAATQKINIF